MSEILTIKDVQSHVIKAIVGSAITSLFIAIVTGIAFYYGTNAAIARLNENQSDMKKTIEIHTDLINKATNGMGMTEVQQQNFEKRLNSIEQNHKEIYNILIQINSNLKNK
jgi:hypothetical protein